jgi:diadenosine tetraphosphatase ApaH/serine/threonine PP2A family protein phosphatase
MKAIISDIHSNAEALRAVLGDIRKRQITEIVCLGDVIGYGPDPRECIELVRDCDTIILGNHEEAVLTGDSAAFNSRARRAVDWTREELMGEKVPEEDAKGLREFLEGFRIDADIEGIRYIHGSPRNPTREYINPRDIRNRKKMEAIFAAVESVCFVGHTHLPGVFTEEGFSSPQELLGPYMLDGNEKAIINVGSVGQPRDGDLRACYATFEVDTVVFRRVEYDPAPVVARIRAVPELDNSLGERLLGGR